MRHAAGHHHTSEAALWHSSHSERCCAIQMALPKLMARGPTRSAMHVVGQEQLGAGWMGCAEAGCFAAGVAAMLSYAFVVRKNYQKRARSKRLLGWVQVQICTANLYSYPFAERGKNSPLSQSFPLFSKERNCLT